MVTCSPNDVVPSSLFRSSSTSTHHRPPFRLWGSSFLRKILNSIRCGAGSSSRRRRSSGVAPYHLHSSPSKRPPDSESGSVKLSDLFRRSSQLEPEDFVAGGGGADGEKTAMKVVKFEEFSEAVRLLQREAVEERENGAKMVRRLAKEDGEARVTLAMMGAIPPLIATVDDDDEIRDEFRVEALYALLNLGIANDLNKAAIVQAGAVHKMLKTITSSNGSPDSSVSEAIVANFLALSASDSNKSIIGSSGAIPFLVSILKELDGECSFQAKQDSLKALYNLSLLPSNVPMIIETDLVRFLMSILGDMEVSERILSILSNVVAVPEGRKALSAVPDAFPILIDILNWNDSPGCQDKASYILMVMAHKAYNDRHTMIEAGIVSALLELTLIGSTLAQKRASRILACLRVDKGKNVRDGGSITAAVSAPIHGGPSSSSLSLGRGLKEGLETEEKKAVKQLVQQSLQNNMTRITRRANLQQDFAPSEHLKSLTSSSTSKSLPF